MEFEKNDLVIVYVSNQDRNQNKCDYVICDVLEVGRYDLFCQAKNKYTTRIFKVSKKRCVKIQTRNFKYSDHHPVKPRIGDLVSHIKDTYSSGREEYTGIIENIIYDPTTQQETMYIVRIGQDTTRAYLENIVILEPAT